MLGEALEMEFGVDLTIGPSLEEGFYYDCFMGDKVRPWHGGSVGGVDPRMQRGLTPPLLARKQRVWLDRCGGPGRCLC